MASPGEPALCQLCRHTFVCYKLAVTRQGAGRTETKSHVVDCLVLVMQYQSSAWLAVKTASEMTYIVSSGASNSTPTNEPCSRQISY